MKELSIEGKATRYDEAISMAKKFYTPDSNNANLKATLEMIFPELKESEDERIRKAIHIYLDWLDGRNKDYHPKGVYTIKDMIAWLEKQATPQVRTGIEWVNTIDDACDERYAEEYSHGEYCHEQSFKWGFQEGVEWLEKQGGQKQDVSIQINPSEYINDMGGNGCYLKNTAQASAWSEEDKMQLDAVIHLVSSTGHIETTNWLKNLKEKVLPQPKPEWEQENTGDLTDFENAMMHIGDSFFGQHAGLDPNDANAIKEQANILLELVSSKEWSEEDERILSGLISSLVRIGANTRTDSTSINYTFPREIAWLKSLKDRVQPQNTITDEELAQAKKEAYNETLNKIEYHSGEQTFDDGWSAAIWYLKKRN